MEAPAEGLKQDEALLRDWIDYLRQQPRADSAEQAIRLILGDHWADYLVLAYGKVRSSDPARQLVRAQSWLRERPNDVDLLITLGRLSLMNEDAPGAREYFESALKLSTRPEVYAELGRVCVELGEEKRGTDYLLRSVSEQPVLSYPRGA